LRRARRKQNEFLEKALELEDKMGKQKSDKEEQVIELDERMSDMEEQVIKRDREKDGLEGERAKRMKEDEKAAVGSGMTDVERERGKKRQLEAENADADTNMGEVAILEVVMETNEEEVEEACEWAIDDFTGEELDLQKVQEARREEIEFMESLPAYDLVDEEECWEKTKRAPIYEVG
jgi:hypothetical protein